LHQKVTKNKFTAKQYQPLKRGFSFDLLKYKIYCIITIRIKTQINMPLSTLEKPNQSQEIQNSESLNQSVEQTQSINSESVPKTSSRLTEMLKKTRDKVVNGFKKSAKSVKAGIGNSVDSAKGGIDSLKNNIVPFTSERNTENEKSQTESDPSSESAIQLSSELESIQGELHQNPSPERRRSLRQRATESIRRLNFGELSKKDKIIVATLAVATIGLMTVSGAGFMAALNLGHFGVLGMGTHTLAGAVSIAEATAGWGTAHAFAAGFGATGAAGAGLGMKAIADRFVFAKEIAYTNEPEEQTIKPDTNIENVNEPMDRRKNNIAPFKRRKILENKILTVENINEEGKLAILPKNEIGSIVKVKIAESSLTTNFDTENKAIIFNKETQNPLDKLLDGILKKYNSNKESIDPKNIRNEISELSKPEFKNAKNSEEIEAIRAKYENVYNKLIELVSKKKKNNDNSTDGEILRMPKKSNEDKNPVVETNNEKQLGLLPEKKVEKQTNDLEKSKTGHYLLSKLAETLNKRGLRLEDPKLALRKLAESHINKELTRSSEEGEFIPEYKVKIGSDLINASSNLKPNESIAVNLNKLSREKLANDNSGELVLERGNLAISNFKIDANFEISLIRNTASGSLLKIYENTFLSTNDGVKIDPVKQYQFVEKPKFNSSGELVRKGVIKESSIQISTQPSAEIDSKIIQGELMTDQGSIEIHSSEAKQGETIDAEIVEDEKLPESSVKNDIESIGTKDKTNLNYSKPKMQRNFLKEIQRIDGNLEKPEVNGQKQASVSLEILKKQNNGIEIAKNTHSSHALTELKQRNK
jgi:hypothetical protein